MRENSRLKVIKMIVSRARTFYTIFYNFSLSLFLSLITYNLKTYHVLTRAPNDFVLD